MSYPFAEFFSLLKQAGFCITLRDYYRLQQVLSTQGEWTLQRLERVLIALFANNKQQIQVIKAAFKDSFSLPQDTKYQAVLDIAQCRQQILALINELPVSNSSESLHSPLPATPPNKKTDSSKDPVKSNQYKKIALTVLALILFFSLIWFYPSNNQKEVIEPTKPEQAKPEQAKPEQAKPEQAKPEQAKPEQAKPEPTNPKTSNTQGWLWLGLFFSILAIGTLLYAYWRSRPLKIKRYKNKIDVIIKKDFFDDSLLGGKPSAWLALSEAEQVSEQLQYITSEYFTEELAVEQSILASIAAGHSQLRFQAYKTIQPVLILTSLTPQFSSWHSMAQELAKGLMARGIKVTTGTCQQSFDYFTDQDLSEHNLADWQQENPEARLFIFIDTQSNQAIQRFNANNWHQLQVLTVRDRLQWDYREWQLLARGVPLQEATSQNILQLKQNNKSQAYNTVHYQSFELQRTDESDIDYLKRVLGETLPLAQALSVYPRAWSLTAADSLRKQYFPQLNRLSLQRCLRLATPLKANSYRFNTRWQAVLLELFQQSTAAHQQAIKKHWLALLNECEPKNKKSNAWAGWRWRKSLLLWNDNPNQQTETIAALLANFPDFETAIKKQSTQLFKQLNSDKNSIEGNSPQQMAKKAPTTRHAKRLFQQLLLPDTAKEYSQHYLQDSFAQKLGLSSAALAIISLAIGWLIVQTPPKEPILPVATIIKKDIKIDMKMVDIPAGRFIMGCVEGIDNAGDLKCYSDEKPSHQVTVPAFQLGQYEVTNAQYIQFLNAVNKRGEKGKEWFKTKEEDSKSHIIATKGGYQVETGYQQHPVNNISWYGAQAYIAWLNQQSGDKGKWRLPTEAEWEYAARGNTKPRSAYFWGNKLGENNANCDKATCKDSYKQTAPVGSFKKQQHPWGLYDMHGNVWEWVEDCWVSNYNNAPKDGSAVSNCDTGVSRVLRGGSWDFYNADLLRSASRDDGTPAGRVNDVGFRVARTR